MHISRFYGPTELFPTKRDKHSASKEITEKVGINQGDITPARCWQPAVQAGCARGAAGSRRTIRLQLTTTANNKYCTLARNRPR